MVEPKGVAAFGEHGYSQAYQNKADRRKQEGGMSVNEGHLRRLPIDFPKHYAATGSKGPWPETLGVYVDAHRRFYVNGELTKPEDLEQKLREEWGRRIVWTVYVEGDGMRNARSCRERKSSGVKRQ